jgi:hypothetical protein
MKNTKKNTSEKSISPKDKYLIIIVFYACAFSYFRFLSGYIMFFQEQQFIFTFTGDYIMEFFLKPGGLLELSGKFFTQFYADKTIGSLLLSLVLTIPLFLLFRINEKTENNKLTPFIIFPSCLLLLMQSHYYHFMELNLGVVFVLLVYQLSEKLLVRKHYFILILYPVIYYLIGSFIWLFLLIHVFKLLTSKDKGRFIFISILFAEAFLIPFLFKKFLFLGSYKLMYFSPWPFLSDTTHNVLMVMCLLYIPAFIYISGLSLRRIPDIFLNRTFSLISILIIFLLTFSFLMRINDVQTGKVVRIEELVFEGKNNEAIEYQEKEASGNLISQYFYNVALARTDQLCDRLFFSRQDFGSSSLILPWGNKHLSWGSYFFYEAGLSNEAERWAYEEMVAYGRKPQNITMLIKTNLVNGNYRMADKYIGILKNTLFYRKEAATYEKMTTDSLSLFSDADISGKRMVLPDKDFFIYVDSAENNLPMLVNANMNNKKAYEYLMSWLMLNKNVEAVVNNTALLKKMGYTRIPRHIEEAILMYQNSTGRYPDLGGLTLSRESMERFDAYFNTYIKARNNPSSFKEIMRSRFGNTYWYYYHFS